MYGNPVAEAQSVVILKLSCSRSLWLFLWTETVAVLVDCGLMREYCVFTTRIPYIKQRKFDNVLTTRCKIFNRYTYKRCRIYVADLCLVTGLQYKHCWILYFTMCMLQIILKLLISYYYKNNTANIHS